MKRREIIEEAKQFVLYYGPNNVLEFGSELLQGHVPAGDPREECLDEILAEAGRQAVRVYNFLGYNPPAE